MKPIQHTLARLALTLALSALLTAGLVGCGGGGGGSGKDAPVDGPQGIRFAVNQTYNQMVYSVDITGPASKESKVLALSPGQEMFVPLPIGNYTLQYWIHAGGGFSVIDHTLRYTSVQPSKVTQVVYP